MNSPMHPPRRYPDFICIGAQKAGTTWLYANLKQHPRIWFPPIKEIHYFNRVHRSIRRDDTVATYSTRRQRIKRAITRLKSQTPGNEELNDRIAALSRIAANGLTDEWYGTIFGAAPEFSCCGEITPEYALLPDAGVEHLASLNPQVKIVFILRDPIERSWSALRMREKRHRMGEKTYQDRVANKRFIAYSNYPKTIERVRRYIPEENFLILLFDDIERRPCFLIETVCNLIGIDYRPLYFKNITERINSGDPTAMEPELYELLRRTMAPIYTRLLDLDCESVRAWREKHYASSDV